MLAENLNLLLVIGVVGMVFGYPNEEAIVDCVVDSGVERNDLKNLNWEDLESFPEKTKCFMKCIIEKEHIFDKEGNVNMENVEKNLEELDIDPNQREEFKTCVQKSKHVKTCEDTIPVLQCFVKFSPKAKSK
ncbi:uncharacterized protein LOC123320634 [Coccinella septempunctata]|uniref:uncharacterized protein LOC123320634 n=1 Tax=Coccinella septempunctata TaxID=41139 RepID=UPI001D081C1A|nr:uncharacterized protein LOC123320634 [Coccinella septempunctata]